MIARAAPTEAMGQHAGTVKDMMLRSVDADIFFLRHAFKNTDRITSFFLLDLIDYPFRFFLN